MCTQVCYHGDRDYYPNSTKESTIIIRMWQHTDITHSLAAAANSDWCVDIMAEPSMQLTTRGIH